jgi:hypothetical protein
MSVLEDEETQKNGIVGIAYICEFGLNNKYRGRKSAKVLSAVPARMRGIYF